MEGADTNCPKILSDHAALTSNYSKNQSRKCFHISLYAGVEFTLLTHPHVLRETHQLKAVDLSHHISDYARRYAPSPLKGLQKHHDNKIVLSGSK